jgi:hypothetical protein
VEIVACVATKELPWFRFRQWLINGTPAFEILATHRESIAWTWVEIRIASMKKSREFLEAGTLQGKDMSRGAIVIHDCLFREESF